jgi:hypothetical protein
MSYHLKAPDGSLSQAFSVLPGRFKIPGIGTVHGAAAGWTGHGGWRLDYVDDTPPAPSLAEQKTAATVEIDIAAEHARLRYITPGSGMALTYAEKANEAMALAALGQPAADAMTDEECAAQYPILSASVGIEGATIWICAQLVLAKQAAWKEIARQIEAARFAGKAAVEAASDATAVAAAQSACVQALSVI